MTVSYQYEVASSTSGGFTRLLFMWKGSLYKLIYRELLLFITAFGLLSALYRHAFTENQKRSFEKAVMYCDTFINLIPLSFVLGFYVSYVASRWWQQYMAIPWPDKIMHSIALYVNGNDDHGRMVRRTLVRYLNLSLILVLRSISSAVKRRFPTLEHLVDSGFMTHVELEMYQSVPSVEFNTYWIPCTWFISLLKETKRGSRITDSQGLKLIMEVVTIATYSFFLAALVGRQYVDDSKKAMQMEIDIYIPVFTILQFFFFMGLLKVAEQLINPFGDDDEDFELNWIIDRHTKVSYLGVDLLMRRCPPLTKDLYFDEVDLTLPYTEAAVAYKKKTYRGSVHNMQVPEEKHTMYLPEILEEDEGVASDPKIPNAKSSSAAGIWRSRPPSSRSLFKYGDSGSVCQTVDENFQADMFTIPERKTSLVNTSHWSAGPTHENIKLKHVDSNASNIFTWPSSSTLGQSEHSFKISQQSLEEPSSYTNLSSVPDYHRHRIGLIPSAVLRSTHGLDKYPVSEINPKNKSAFHLKSLSKLPQVKKHNVTEGKKRGVRWKPLVTSAPCTEETMHSSDANSNNIHRCFNSSMDIIPVTLRHKESIVSGTSNSIKSEHCYSSDTTEKYVEESGTDSACVHFERREGVCSFPCLRCSEEADSALFSESKHNRHHPTEVIPSGLAYIKNKRQETKTCSSLPSVINPQDISTTFLNLKQIVENEIDANRLLISHEENFNVSDLGTQCTLTLAQNDVVDYNSDNTGNVSAVLPQNEVIDCNSAGRGSSSTTGVVNRNTVEESSWHSADWSTLLNGDIIPEVIPSLNTEFYIHARPDFNSENYHS